MELRQAKKIFYIAKKSENVTGRTLETYEEVLPKFFEYLVQEDNIFDVTEVDTSHIQGYLITLQEKGLRGITMHKHFRNLRTFFLFLHQEDYITRNPIKNVKPPKPEQKEMRTFNAKEINKLLNGFDRNSFIGLRNACIMAMFFATGMRKSELVKLTLADVNITNDLIRIDGKGNKERFTPIGRVLRRLLIQYLRAREEFLEGDNSNQLFVTVRASRKMTGSCLSILFRKLKKELKIEGERVSCHTMRHTFAKNYLLNGGDVFSLQKILGHADIATTRKYINLNDGELKIQHAKYNPLDNKDWLY